MARKGEKGRKFLACHHLATLPRNVFAEGKPSPRELEGMQENPVKGEANQASAVGQRVTSHE